MSVRSLPGLLLTLLCLAAVLSTVYLYLYPAVHSCAFPTPSSAYPASTTDDSGLIRPVHRESVNDGDEAPFRLLVLADPQLEGDSSLPDPDNGFLPRLGRHWQEVSEYNLSYAD